MFFARLSGKLVPCSNSPSCLVISSKDLFAPQGPFILPYLSNKNFFLCFTILSLLHQKLRCAALKSLGKFWDDTQSHPSLKPFGVFRGLNRIWDFLA